jgi:uncharacterized membrane protein
VGGHHLAATTGTSVERRLVVVTPGVEPRASRRSRRLTRVMWLVVCLFFVVLGAATAWSAASDLPGPTRAWPRKARPACARQ